METFRRLTFTKLFKNRLYFSFQIYESCRDTNERTGIRVIITIRQNILEQSYSKLKDYKLFAKDKIVDCSTEGELAEC